MGYGRFAVFLTLLLSASISADSITGTVSFSRSAPFAGVIYLPHNDARQHQASVDQLNRVFTENMIIGSSNTEVLFNNSDRVRHNLFAKSVKTGTEFNVGTVPPGKLTKIPLSWEQDTMVRVGCLIHSNMKTYVANIKSDYYSVIDIAGPQQPPQGFDDYDDYANSSGLTFTALGGVKDFAISDVPDDLTKLVLLLPNYDKIEFFLKKGDSREIALLRRGRKRGVLNISRQ